MSTYDIVYADPPWKYDFQESNCRRIENHYDTMPLEEIKRVGIPANRTSALFLWTTAPKLTEALDLMSTWGFQYKTHLIWDKETIGTGYWFRGQHELLLVGTKGAFPCPNESLRISSVLRQRKTEHSRKPDSIRRLISSWYPNLSKIELFAREAPMGWDIWGNEVPKETKITRFLPNEETILAF